jgi:hypothetical protein
MSASHRCRAHRRNCFAGYDRSSDVYLLLLSLIRAWFGLVLAFTGIDLNQSLLGLLMPLADA